jgi:tetrahydromethanopterin S-methyltransferase subunit H
LGQVGLTAVTVLVILPLMQVMVDFFATGLAAGAGVAVAAGVGVTEALGDGVGAGASWVSFTLIVGDE